MLVSHLYEELVSVVNVQRLEHLVGETQLFRAADVHVKETHPLWRNSSNLRRIAHQLDHRPIQANSGGRQIIGLLAAQNHFGKPSWRQVHLNQLLDVTVLGDQLRIDSRLLVRIL